MAASALAAAAMACNCGTPAMCTDACPASGATRCAGLEVETCAADPGGCLAWSAPAACGDQRLCTGSACAGCAVAAPCDIPGATRCAGASVERCAADADGCLGWSAPAACGGQATCTGSGCTALFLYAAGGAAGTFAFSLDPASAALTELPGSPFAGNDSRPAAHPTGRFLYVSDTLGNTVGAYALQPDGGLQAVGPRLGAGSFPETLTVHPAGTFLYVGNVFAGGLGVYAIDPATGGLTARAPVGFGNYDHGVVCDPTGRYLYVSRNNNDDVTRFVLDGGAPVDPRTLPAAGGYHSAVDPHGRFLFVSDWDKSGANLLSSYALSPADGTPSRVGDFPTGGGNPAGVAVTPDGRFVYVVNSSAGTVAGFSVAGGADAGALTALPGSPWAAGGGAWELSLDPAGRYLFIGRGAGVASFAIAPDGGVLTPLPGSPTAVRASGATLGATVVVPVPQ